MNFNIFSLIFTLQRIIMYSLGAYIFKSIYNTTDLTILNYSFFILSPGFFILNLLNRFILNN
jgi:hypothetical protein